VHVTIGIPTWNRAELLRQTLESLVALRVPDGVRHEIVVIDNNSPDHTSAVLDAFAGRLPLTKRFEPQLGKSHAHNTAIDQLDPATEYIIWLDDDVLVDPDLVAAYVAAFRANPDAGVFGGSIEPWFDGEPPEWLVAAMPLIGGVYAVRSGLTGTIRSGDVLLPFGANWAVRADLQRGVRYDARLGRRGTLRLAGEETEVIRALLGSGQHGLWVPDAHVRHFIPAAHQSLGYLRRYYTGMGESLGMMESPKGRFWLFGRPLWVWRQALVSELWLRLFGPLLPPQQRIRLLCDAAMGWGRLRAPAHRAAS
jgi:glycosyltransferase involved in cell wall biosynthesis